MNPHALIYDSLFTYLYRGLRSPLARRIRARYARHAEARRRYARTLRRLAELTDGGGS
jgi:hypothetical protein